MPKHAIIAFLILVAAVSARAEVVTYPVPDEAKDSPYSVKVNGTSVPVEKAGYIHGAYYARFQADESARCIVVVRTSGDPEISVKPERLAKGPIIRGRAVTFDVTEPGPRIITVKADGHDLPPLLVIADPVRDEPYPATARTYRVRDYVDGDGVQTERIQKALDECASKGGGVVRFDPGIYVTGTLRIGDNTTVYLAPGSLILGSEDPADFPVDEGRKEEGTHGPVCSFSRLIMFDRCRNSRLIGHGVIDGSGHVIRNKHGRHVQLVDVTASSDILIRDVVLRNSAEWTLHILGCENVDVENLKIINDWAVSNTDGVNPDGSKNVRITNYFGFCGDDAVAVKTTGNLDILRPAEDIVVRDSVVMTRKTSLKIGTETYADIRNVLFENCDIVNSSRGLAIWMRDGHAASDIMFRDIRLDLREIGSEGMSGEPIRVSIEARHGIGSVKNVTFERIHSKAPYRSIFYGMAESPLEGFTFKDCVWEITPRMAKMDKQPVMDISRAKEFRFINNEVIWPKSGREHWDGILRVTESEGILGEMRNAE